VLAGTLRCSPALTGLSVPFVKSALVSALWATQDLNFQYHRSWVTLMCRNIRTLFNFDPPVTEDEIRAASLQFVRKISGFTRPSKANEAAFAVAIDEVASASARLLQSLETAVPPKNREEEAAKAKARAAERFGT
jgi:hypothetical protein